MMKSPERNGCNIPIDDETILRDEELFYLKKGMGLYKPSISAKVSGQVRTLPQSRIIWLPSETEQVAQLAEQKQLLLVGELGAGKSALVYGLRAKYRDTERPYVYIDGHFSKTEPTDIEQHLDWAVKHEAVTNWDSLDYLIGGSRKIRKLSRNMQRERSKLVGKILLQYLNENRPFVGTSHSEPWIRTYGDPVLIEEIWTDILSHLTPHLVRGVFDTPEEAIQFYCHAGINEPEATYLATIPNNRRFLKVLGSHNTEPSNPKLYEEVSESLRKYRLAKLIALDEREDSERVRKGVAKFTTGLMDETEFLTLLGGYVLDKNRETKQKMGMLGGDIDVQ